MLVLTAGNTVYTRPVAKVMISIPDDLLERVDQRATALDETRSGFLQRVAEAELEASEAANRAEARRLFELIKADFRDDEPHYDASQLIREDRDSR
jgi:metal-responsive CopG/Arc/MetJ family transcriptional regulator